VPSNDDNACQATAERINRSQPNWLVIYGCYTKRFWAFALFEMRRRMIVHAAYPDALIARMHDAERRFRIRPGQEERRKREG
jgi:hypothetical protein